MALGGQGVAVFFVISGFSVSASFSSSKGFKDYINKRFWRIAPLYYFWILIAVLAGTTNVAWQETNHVRVDAYNILMHITFLSALDYKIAPTLLGVDWTLSIEMFWYFVIPTILMWAKGFNRLAILAILSCTIYIASHLIIHFFIRHDAKWSILHWSPVPYVLGFILGLVAFRLRQMDYNWAKWGNASLALLLILLLLYLYIPISIMVLTSYVFFTMVSFVLILFGSKENFLYRFVFANPCVLILGTLSYGIYLSHITFLGIMGRYNFFSNLSVKLLLCIAASVAVSYVMYFVLEKPGMAAGKSMYLNYLRD